MIKLKTQNYKAIRNHVITGAPTIQGSKLQALYTLIQAKGEAIEADGWMSGLMALKISESEYIAIEHTPVSPSSFYPCKIKSILLETID